MIRKMYTPVTFRHYEGYGYGWYVGFYEFEENGKKVNYFQHSGGMPGHTSLITRLPDDDYFIVLLNNTGHTKLKLINYQIIRILYGYDWKMKNDLTVELNNCKNTKEIDKLKKEFYENEENYFESENHLGGLVYQKITSGKYETGQAIFNFGMELYPNSQSLLYSIAESYYKTGKHKLAKEYFKKLADMLPENRRVIRRLKLINELLK
jgi:tetratricopeptide (TPR) repeat protein